MPTSPTLPPQRPLTPHHGVSVCSVGARGTPRGEAGMSCAQKELQGTEASRPPTEQGKETGPQREAGMGVRRRGAKGNPLGSTSATERRGTGFSPTVDKALSSYPNSAPAGFPEGGCHFPTTKASCDKGLFPQSSTY